MRTKNNFQMVRHIVLSSFLFFLSIELFAQDEFPPRLMDPDNPFIQNNALLTDPDGGIIYFNPNVFPPFTLFTLPNEFTGLGPFDEMDTIKTWEDSLSNLQHILYQQYHRGIEVEGAQYTEIHDGNSVWLTSGFVAENLDMNVNPAFEEGTALQMALAYFSAETYAWMIDETDTIIDGEDTVIVEVDPMQFYPTGKLVLALVGDRKIRFNNYVLAWKFDIVSLNPHANKTIYVDAMSGMILKELSNICTAGDFNHVWYGMKWDLDTRKKNRWPGADRWYTTSPGDRNLYTTDYFHNQSGYYSYNWQWDNMAYSNGDDHWGNDNWSATASHYCAQKAWDFYRNTYGRRGITGWGKHLRIVSDYGDNLGAYYENAYNEDYIIIDRLNNRLLATYDVVGHEFTHGVDQHSRNLAYERESGALDESFADIFGFMTERSMGGGWDWTMGEDASNTIRDMANPNNYNQPRFYGQSPYWHNVVGCSPNGYNDYCGVHTNSGVQNKWFHLLSMGGSQVVNGQNRMLGSGIGIDKAARIAYYTLTNLVNKYENYNAVRAHSIAAATILYGFCSNEYNKTWQAWHVVNVGPPNYPCAIAWYPPRNGGHYRMGIEDEEKNKNVELYPNPANDVIHIQTSGLNTIMQVSLIDITGRLILRKEFQASDKISLELPANIDNGSYFAQILLDDGNIHVEKIIIIK